MLGVVQDVSDRTRGTGVPLEKDHNTGNQEKRETDFKNQHNNLFRGNEITKVPSLFQWAQARETGLCS